MSAGDTIVGKACVGIARQGKPGHGYNAGIVGGNGNSVNRHVGGEYPIDNRCVVERNHSIGRKSGAIVPGEVCIS
jgi:hypothetical protein